MREIDGIIYVRISCFIYNEISDYEALRDAILEMCENRDKIVDCNSEFWKLQQQGWCLEIG